VALGSGAGGSVGDGDGDVICRWRCSRWRFFISTVFFPDFGCGKKPVVGGSHGHGWGITRSWRWASSGKKKKKKLSISGHGRVKPAFRLRRQMNGVIGRPFAAAHAWSLAQLPSFPECKDCPRSWILAGDRDYIARPPPLYSSQRATCIPCRAMVDICDLITRESFVSPCHTARHTPRFGNGQAGPGGVATGSRRTARGRGGR